MIRTEGRITYKAIPRAPQIALVLTLAVTGGWTAFSTTSFFLRADVLADKDRQIAEARYAYRSLLSEVADYQHKFNSINRELEENHSVMLGLVEQNAGLQQNLRSVESQLRTSEVERDKVISNRERLKAELAEVESQINNLSHRNVALKDNLSSVETTLQSALDQRNLAMNQGREMKHRIQQLEDRLSELQTTQQDAVARLTDRVFENIEDVERVVAMTGITMEEINQSDESLSQAQGGPFIEAKPDAPDEPASQLKASLSTLDQHLDRWEGLQEILSRVPLTAPLDYGYYITSSYGKRRDPVNNKWAMHYGLDMGGAFKSAVYVTAPGVVTHAGWKGKYGQMIEIDHGSGIKTRYGHLNKVLVNVGDKVDHRQKIGLLGSTGRSTGAHLHYEVLFKDKNRDPLKFIKAGRYVFQKQQQE